MSDSDLRIIIRADASGVAQGADKAKTALGGIASQAQLLGASLASLGARLQGAVQTLQESLTDAAQRGDDERRRKAVESVAAALAAETQLVRQQTNAVTQIRAEALHRQDVDRRADLVRFQREWDSAVNPLVSTFARGLEQMGEGTRNFGQVVRSLEQQMLDDLVRNVERIVERWLESEAAKTLATRTGVTQRTLTEAEGAETSGGIDALASLKQIGNAAATAAGKAYAAMAGIPPAPLWGIAAGAAAFAGVMAFRGLVSAAGGFDIPTGVNPIAQLHAQEMVLPARLANPMRDMLASYGAGALPIAPAAGDTHLHYAPTINAPDGQSLSQMLLEQSSDFLAFVQTAIRNGSLKVA